MFQQIYHQWINNPDEYRANFLSYPYLFYKFVELLGLEDYKKYVELLKSDEKLKTQDVYWKKLMNELSAIDPNLWVFIPTI
jgi:hypothetical protein